MVVYRVRYAVITDDDDYTRVWLLNYPISMEDEFYHDEKDMHIPTRITITNDDELRAWVRRNDYIIEYTGHWDLKLEDLVRMRRNDE